MHIIIIGVHVVEAQRIVNLCSGAGVTIRCSSEVSQRNFTWTISTHPTPITINAANMNAMVPPFTFKGESSARSARFSSLITVRGVVEINGTVVTCRRGSDNQIEDNFRYVIICESLTYLIHSPIASPPGPPI